MNPEDPPVRLAVRDVDDLVGLIPFLVGFHPRESLVVLMLDAGVVAVTARIDLAAMSSATEVGELLARLFGRFPSAQGWFLAFGEDESNCWQVLDECADQVGEARLGRLVQVGSQHWRADHPGGEIGTVRVTPAAAQAAVLGLPVRGSRSELAAQISGPSAARAAELGAAFAAADAWMAQLAVRRRGEQALQLLAECSDSTEQIRLAVLAADPQVQAVLLDHLDQGNAAVAQRAWFSVLNVCPQTRSSAALGLLGVASWLGGDGALQTICLERLDQHDPLHPLAALLDWINTTVLPPGSWAAYRRVLIAAALEHGRLLRDAG